MASGKRAALALGIALVAVALVSVALGSDARADPPMHVVQPGETLGAIALRHGVGLEMLRRWNRLQGDRILAGQRLLVGAVATDSAIDSANVQSSDDAEAEEPETLRYVVVPGDTLGCIARRYGVSLETLRAANPELSGLPVGVELAIPGGVDPRAALELMTGSSSSPSISWGAASCGLVVGSVRLRPHPAYVLRNPARSYGTRSTVNRIRRAFAALRRAHPGAPRVRVHDLGLEGGGPIDDHRSHQSGRDVDITYYRRTGCARGGCPLSRVSPADLDVRRQWALFSHWIERGDAEVIFVDYALQAPLYREAARRGVSETDLARIFQYPRGRWTRDAVIRHFPNHRDHFHARFACRPSEPDCR